ncbi:hypothetical protein H0W91_02735 [Patescibacteria group bacterium]|nr:hypothetical protein [Patescibacteria group bacterium]
MRRVGIVRPVSRRTLNRIEGQMNRERKRDEEKAKKEAEIKFKERAKEAGFSDSQVDWLLQNFAKIRHTHL